MAKIKLASREDILGFDDTRFEDVTVPEWDGLVVRVKTLNALEMQRFYAILDDRDEQTRIKIVAFTCIDEQGEALFTPEDVQALAAKSFPAIRRLSDAAFRLNRMSSQNGTGEKDAQRIEENFTGTRDGGSRSSSP